MFDLRTIMLFVGVLVVQGCSTSLDVCKLEDPGSCPSFSWFSSSDKKQGRVIGVPYHLTKTEFLLSVEPPSEKSPLTTYTINQVNTPDLKHRYWVNIDPAVLTKTNFKLTFGSKGELTSTSFNATEQVTPTIKAVGEFAVAAIGAAAGVAGKAALGIDEGAATSEEMKLLSPAALRATLEKLRELNTPPDCKDGGGTPTEAQKDERIAMLARMKDILDLNSTKQFSKLFAYRSAVEKCWLQTADSTLKNRIETRDKRSDVYQNAVNAYKAADVDAERRNKIADGVEKAIQVGTMKDFKSFIEFVRVLVKDQKQEVTDAISKLSTVAEQEFRDIEPLRKQRTLISEIVKLDTGAWRDRYAAFLEEKIAQEERRLIEAGTLTDSDDLKQLRKQLAYAIGAKEEVERIMILRDFLRQIPMKVRTVGAHAEQGPAMGEYETARKELEALLTVVAQKRSALIPAIPAQPKQSRILKPTLLWSKTQLKGEDLRAILRKEGKLDASEYPEFIVGIEREYRP